MIPLFAFWLQTSTPGGDALPSPYVQWGVAGSLLLFILWLYMDERKEHKALRAKVLSDVLPALIENNDQMKESSAAVVMIHQLASRPSVDPVTVAELARDVRDLRDELRRLRSLRGD